MYRLLVVNTSKVLAAAAAMPDWDEIMVIVNDPTYGGSGGSLAVISTNGAAVQVAQHEYGHTFSRLADEYTTPFPGYPACSDMSGPACEPNVTDQTSRALIKWFPWIDAGTPIPTPNQTAYRRVVGLFQGARYLGTGMYRPKSAAPCSRSAAVLPDLQPGVCPAALPGRVGHARLGNRQHRAGLRDAGSGAGLDPVSGIRHPLGRSSCSRSAGRAWA